MPRITVSRGGGWTDALRAYVVLIDDAEVGTLARHETRSFDVGPGRHSLQLRIGPCSSPKLELDVADDLAFQCGPAAKPFLAALQLSKPHAWIWLRPAPQSVF